MDATGSLLVYATIDSQEINTVMKGDGGNLLMNNGFGGGSLVTISFQMVGNIFPATILSMELVKESNALILHTIHKIKSALKCK
ncbi:hypothetical protein H5410_031606 [Solanum commersonii]|uniref:HD-Zip IV C-terminal domain-containing protein n=1 Tax=Solanum commersonii TaxID=4109 RepID=A0A9J5YM79_SOLCO|nr:hypothetical protein H5410_031606 [Solanum commersonii]